MIGHLKRRTVGMAALLLLLPSCAGTQVSHPEPATPPDSYSARDVREDLDMLYRTLGEAQYDPYARVTKVAYEQHFEQLRHEITGPMKKPQAHLLFQKLLAFGRIAHAHTEAPLIDALDAVRAGEPVFPLDVVYRDGKAVLANWPDATDTLPPGSRLLAFDGQDMASIDAQLRNFVSADTDDLLHAQLVKGFPIYLALLFPGHTSLEVRAVRPDGQEVTHEIRAIAFSEIGTLRKSRPVPRLATDFGSREFRIDDGIGYLRPGPFSNLPGEKAEDSAGYEPAPFVAFLDKAFATFEAAGVKDLLIDLRGNPGGDNSFSDPMIARFAYRPFRFASRFSLRASAATKARYAKGTYEQGTLLAAMVEKEASTPNGTRYDFELPFVEPVEEGRFDGKVWALIDRQSYSNAVSVAAILKDYGFATPLGEATADLATTYGSVEHFSLPHSKVQVAYPKSYIVRPNGDETVHGVQPDIALAPQPIGESRDVVLEQAYAAIGKR
ncbi:S41 family peptidase [Novosphingobium mangrovi (ex Huang et al. 2023)]|uniref:S41 family peptidase n=1 Tax=Novosphingobium mangrovi (ex Huang et al. 2023) TaxID=2976432 RepID=A0ABT2I434_9SPHN|nr:S41 family peptidase [Novosphingobium mangrovi (ex Huang et al. 2023)]MCT2399572.1 S41 family peptidase [Novosphingobium mangrovi (ex Huang et al. 2023)]